MIVIGELDARLLADFSSAVESFGGAMPAVLLFADFFRDPGTNDVTMPDDFGELDLSWQLFAEDIP